MTTTDPGLTTDRALTGGRGACSAPISRPPLRLVVVGNCQAESLRRLLDGPDVQSVRLPAVHELTEADLDPLHDLLAHADLLVAQPTQDDYRGLPVGTGQLRERLPATARVALVPSVRYAGLYPYHVLVHPPGATDTEPPVVPYHDLRTLVAAAWTARGEPAPRAPALTGFMVRAVADESLDELRRREQEHATVVVSDLVEGPGFDAMRTINHPGNAVLVPLAARLRDTLGLDPRPPRVDRPLLDGIHAPRLPVVADALGVPPRPHWLKDGVAVDVDDVERAHLAWYADRPAFVAEALRRTHVTRALLGLRAPA